MVMDRREFLGTMAATLHALSSPAGLANAATQAAASAAGSPMSSASLLMVARRLISSGSHTESCRELGDLFGADIPPSPPLSLDKIPETAAKFARSEHAVATVLASDRQTEALITEWVRENTEGVRKVACDALDLVSRMMGEAPPPHNNADFSAEELAQARAEVEATIAEWRETIDPNLSITERAAQWQRNLTAYYHPELAPKEEPKPQEEQKPAEKPVPKTVAEPEPRKELINAQHLSADTLAHMEAATPPHDVMDWRDRLEQARKSPDAHTPKY